jgi:hypothetical protein
LTSGPHIEVSNIRLFERIFTCKRAAVAAKKPAGWSAFDRISRRFDPEPPEPLHRRAGAGRFA